MLQNKRQNYHHSKLPALGEIVKIPACLDGHNGLNSRTKHIVISFPLCDNVRPYSIGIHTCIIKNLQNGSTHQVSGYYLVNND